MEYSLEKKFDLIELETYAIQIGIRKDTLDKCLTASCIYNLISQKLNEILEKNKIYYSSKYEELYLYAKSINAQINCQTNETSCIIKSIKIRVLELHKISLLYELNILNFIDNIQEFYKQIQVKQNKGKNALSSYMKDYGDRKIISSSSKHINRNK